MENTMQQTTVQVHTETTEKEKTDFLDKLLFVWEIRHFVPLLTSVGLLGLMFSSAFSFFAYLFIGMIFLGWGMALTVCPLKLITFPFRCACAVAEYTWFWDALNFLGCGFGFAFGVLAILVAPAVFTIRKFMEE